MPEYEYRDPCLTIEDLLVKAGCQPSAVREGIERRGPEFKNMDGELIYRGSDSRFEGMTIEEFCAPEHLKQVLPHYFFADKIIDLEEEAFGGPKINLAARGALLKEVGAPLYNELMQRWGATHTKNGIRPGPAPGRKDEDRSPEGKARSTNPWLAQNWSITAQGSVVKALGIDKAAAIAKAAGSYIGATRPTL